jgi:hypothetical protein
MTLRNDITVPFIFITHPPNKLSPKRHGHAYCQPSPLIAPPKPPKWPPKPPWPLPQNSLRRRRS